jgi:nitrogenase-associated protein
VGAVKITFWEKPGCVGNARQKAILTVAGFEVDARNLLTHPWTAGELEGFFQALPVPEWFNLSAPRVKSGEVVPTEIPRDTALQLLLKEPLLMRRPLMEIGRQRLVGFEMKAIEEAAGHALEGGRIDRLRGENLDQCAGQAAGIRCGETRRNDV